MRVLERDFFNRETTLVAQDLLGKVLETEVQGTKVSGIVVETEAYLGQEDPGSHSFRGKTKRNSVMFGPAGYSYVYQIYGVHFCYNVTTDHDEIPSAVLIRALEPISGINIMKQNRKKEARKDLCSGPAKLVQALGITKSMNGTSAVNGPVRFFDGHLNDPFSIIETTRIGLAQGADLKLRYYIENNLYVSRK